MREILYKARRKDTGEWVYGAYGVLGKDTDVERHVIMLSTLSTLHDDYFYFTDIEVIPETVCQFIGRTDIHDVKVFSGDQCLVWESRGADGRVRRKWERPLTVTYDEYLAKFGFDDRELKSHWDISKFEAFEVVGSIHDKEAAK